MIDVMQQQLLFRTARARKITMAARFEHCDENILKMLDDKDSKNTKKALKGSHLIFKAYLQERNIQNPATVQELVTVL